MHRACLPAVSPGRSLACASLHAVHRSSALVPPCRLQVLGRGERLEVLVQKTDSLGQQAFAFKRQVHG